MTEPNSTTGSGVRLHVGDSAVARIAAQRAARVPGVVALRADLAQALLGIAGTVLGRDRSRLPTDGVSAVVRDAAAEVSVTIVTRLGHNCRDLARAVQREVAAEVAEQTGLAVTVRVTIADVLLD
ncbi:Asp23/Gls24 family envelope stress response protein [Pseudonocardia sp.]|uniref:Asp23/Gls24 family envelope stress response protein n=1 Tax=Pseudonocardia sp. TaxID=60912 RepID=UPI00262A24BF|nr:Asp23/Gls24 family envelope stress response protein [Pseudonocardia sp.]MCW2716255.1 hypothetical protein [Pseudonocardia sp.]